MHELLLRLKSVAAVQIEDGVTDFTPSPSESRQIFASSYQVPQTLLLRFADDGIDDTEQILPILKRRPGRVFERVLPGTHTTPCGDLGSVDSGRLAAPGEAVRSLAAAWLSQDLYKTADTVTSWLERF